MEHPLCTYSSGKLANHGSASQPARMSLERMNKVALQRDAPLTLFSASSTVIPHTPLPRVFLILFDYELQLTFPNPVCVAKSEKILETSLPRPGSSNPQDNRSSHGLRPIDPKRPRTLPAIHRHLRLERPSQFPIPELHKPARSARPLSNCRIGERE